MTTSRRPRRPEAGPTSWPSGASTPWRSAR